MIGIIWNCRGVAKKGLSSYINELIWDHKVDFIGIQETMKKSYSEKKIRKIDKLRSTIGTGFPLMANLVAC
jgi:hypothetical protein